MLRHNAAVPNGLSAQLLPDRTRLTPGEHLTYNVLNTGRIPIAFGRPHLLERFDAGEWRRQPTESGLLRPRPYTVHPGSARRLKLRLPRRMMPGLYRVTLEVRDYARRTEPRILGGVRPDGATLKMDVSFEFTVGDTADESRL
jgi:hypothetical protein